MDVLSDDHEREEAVRKWWREYWKPIVIGIFIAVAGLIGLRQYQSYMLSLHQEKALEVYQHRLNLNTQGADAIAGALEFMNDNPDIFGAVLALDIAAVQIQAADYEGAESTIAFAGSHGGDLIAPAAQLTLARLKSQKGDFAGAEAVLNGFNDDAYVVETKEALGDVYLASGDRGRAREAYLMAVKEALDRNLVISPFLQMKADSVNVPGDQGVYRQVIAEADAAVLTGDLP